MTPLEIWSRHLTDVHATIEHIGEQKLTFLSPVVGTKCGGERTDGGKTPDTGEVHRSA